MGLIGIPFITPIPRALCLCLRVSFEREVLSSALSIRNEMYTAIRATTTVVLPEESIRLYSNNHALFLGVMLVKPSRFFLVDTLQPNKPNA